MKKEAPDTSYINKMRPYEQIWQHIQELQNWSSSSWWFFVLLPKRGDGYGPGQYMFTFASRAGEIYAVNRVWQKGMDVHRPVSHTVDRFMTTAVGWINHGNEVHEEIVLQPVEATLDANGSLRAWAEQENGEIHGGEIISRDDDHHTTDVFFKGKRGHAKFTAWAESEWEYDRPSISDVRSKMGGVHLVAWRKLNFKGEFKSPEKTEQVEGVGYFQRVCMNVPMFPWFWNYTIFEDGSLFSAFQPYVGLQLFRKGTWYFKNKTERAFVVPMSSSYFADHKSKETIVFNHTQVKPIIGKGEHPWFEVRSKNDKGDYIQILFSSYGHAQFLLDRRMILALLESRFNYNEFMIKVERIEGRINGSPLPKAQIGQGWGNMEYTWGISL